MSDSNKFRVHTLVTDGQTTRMILVVERTRSHFIFNYPVRGQDYHLTYHEDGRISARLGRRRRPIEQGPPLGDFKGDGTDFSAFLNIDKPSTWGSAPSKKKAKTVIIDLRPCMGKTNVVSVLPLLLVPGDLAPVDSYRKRFSILKCEVFEETIPWLAIIGYYNA